MVRARLSAISLAAMLLLPGCVSPFGSQEEVEPVPNCQEEPGMEGCFESTITEDDCNYLQVFAGDHCRPMIRPQQLDYGLSSLSLELGEQMQPLTPSFIGDAPSNWAVNPSLPDGLALDNGTGVISGAPSIEYESLRFTIIASNAAGNWPVFSPRSARRPATIPFFPSILQLVHKQYFRFWTSLQGAC